MNKHDELLQRADTAYGCTKPETSRQLIRELIAELRRKDEVIGQLEEDRDRGWRHAKAMAKIADNEKSYADELRAKVAELEKLLAAATLLQHYHDALVSIGTGAVEFQGDEHNGYYAQQDYANKAIERVDI